MKFLILRIDQGGRAKPGPGKEVEEFHFLVATTRTVEEAQEAAIGHLRRIGDMPQFNFGVKSHFAEWETRPEFIRPRSFIL